MSVSVRRFQWWKRAAIFFAVMGPGIITANVDNDAGGITTYSLCGANFGYTLLWSLIPIGILLIMVQEMCNRMGVVTGKGLSSLIRERFGLKITFYLMLGLLFTNLGNIIAEFAGIAASMELFGISKYISVPISAGFVWWLVTKGTYRSVEKAFLVACLFYLAYVVSGFLAKPDWGEVAKCTLIPQFQLKGPYLIMLVGLIGTTIAPWMQFYQQASVVEKGIKIEDYKYSRWDTIIGGVVVTVIAFFIIVVCGATLFKSGITIHTAKDAAMALKPLAGEHCMVLFAIGLLVASLFAASILPLATSFFVCEAFGYESGVNKTFSEAPQFYILYSILIIIGGGIILFPNAPLIPIMLISQVINGVMLPFILVAMILLVNNVKLMGSYVNSKFYNYFSWIAAAIISVLSIVMIVFLFL
ncbi:MAG: Nramp family divalent metal transporter [Candidatus Ancaeobacter aquaticus]|nr:Nramp family divalent metal transporter [Candidatus Ancaeobacter aquaticus]